MSDDEYEALEERAAIIQFCSGREVSRTEAWRMACEQASQRLNSGACRALSARPLE